jgi:hypothetical protein
MVDEVVMGVTVDVPFHSCHDKVASMVDQMATLSSTVWTTFPSA